MNGVFRQAILVTVLASVLAQSSAWCGMFERQWVFSSESSATIYWQLSEISQEAVSQVEYGPGEDLGMATVMTTRARWSHLHHLTGLTPDMTYYYRMVTVDTLTGMRSESPVMSFQTEYKADAIRVPGTLAGPPYVLDQPGAYYLLTEDIASDGTAIRIDGDSVTLDLDGHTIMFGNDTDSQVYGVQFVYNGPGILCNGFIAQGERSGLYSCAIRSSDRPYPRHVFGISTDVHLKCSYPMNILRSATGVRIHHNHFYSRVIDLESRHYPGNAILQVNVSGGDVQIYDNLLTEGCHRGIALGGDGVTDVQVYYNDIQHHQQYVNGYAIIPCDNANIHHNKVTSTGRAVHLNSTGVQLHDNYIETKAHQHRDDLPANTMESNGGNPDQHDFDMNLIEAHGIKFEGSNVRNCKVFDNYVRMVQYLPHDSEGEGDPLEKIDNGVYLKSVPTGGGGTTLTDDTMSWQYNRWRYYSLHYADGLPAANIGGNDRTTLFTYMDGGLGPEYTIYQKWQYVPPTPLNIACYDPAANNEVYGNTFIALTKYETKDIWHGGYGSTGNWASPIMLVSMDNGPAPSGQYSIYVHDNQFISNDLFMNSYEDVNMTVRVENNSFELVGVPHTIGRTSRLRQLGSTLEAAVLAGNNQFSTDETGRKADLNGDGKLDVGDVLALLILFRTDPANPLCDWNVDGTIEHADLLQMIGELAAASQARSAELAGDIETVVETPSPYTKDEIARMESSGQDGL